jgi:hypothetical protein
MGPVELGTTEVGEPRPDRDKMNTTAINAISFAALFVAKVALAESAVFGWHAGAGPTPGIGVVQRISLDGPSTMNKMPEKRGKFSGEYAFAPAWGTVLMAMHIAKAAPDGSLTTRPIKFETGATSADRDPAYQKTHLETESIEFDEGDALIFVFKTGKGTEMVSVRISRKFIPM